jgi:hypothetical protein
MQSKDPDKTERDDAKAKPHVEKEPEAPPPPKVLKNIVAMAVLHNSLYVSDGDGIFMQTSNGKFRPIVCEIDDA